MRKFIEHHENPLQTNILNAIGLMVAQIPFAIVEKLQKPFPKFESSFLGIQIGDTHPKLRECGAALVVGKHQVW